MSYPADDTLLLRSYTATKGFTEIYYKQICMRNRGLHTDAELKKATLDIGEKLMCEHIQISSIFNGIVSNVTQIGFPLNLLSLKQKDNLTCFKQNSVFSAETWIDDNLPHDQAASLRRFIYAPSTDWYPRDYASKVNGRWIINSRIFNSVPNDLPIMVSKLGEGGAVLSSQNVALVNENIYVRSQKDVEKLENQGAIILPLPEVDKQKNKFNNVDNHIDGSAALIEGKERSLYLLCTYSYFNQDERSKGMIIKAAEQSTSNLVIIDDSDLTVPVCQPKTKILMEVAGLNKHISCKLPPLGLNLVQLDSREIFMSSTPAEISGESNSLEQILSEIVGKDKVYSTHDPIMFIPYISKASIRCSSLYAPLFIIKSLYDSALVG